MTDTIIVIVYVNDLGGKRKSIIVRLLFIVFPSCLLIISNDSAARLHFTGHV